MSDIVIVSIIAAIASIATGRIMRNGVKRDVKNDLLAVRTEIIVVREDLKKDVLHVYHQINSRLDQMLKDTHELGRLEGRDKERADQDEKTKNEEE